MNLDEIEKSFAGAFAQIEGRVPEMSAGEAEQARNWLHCLQVRVGELDRHLFNHYMNRSWEERQLHEEKTRERFRDCAPGLVQFGFRTADGQVEIKKGAVEAIAKALGWEYSVETHNSISGKIARESARDSRIWDAFAETLFGPKPSGPASCQEWTQHAEAQIGPRPKRKLRRVE